VHFYPFQNEHLIFDRGSHAIFHGTRRATLTMTAVSSRSERWNCCIPFEFMLRWREKWQSTREA
jgi:hypothetical protein